MPIQPITSFMPRFGVNGDFEECTGWDAVLKHIFLVLVTRPGSRQWNPEFGCTLIDLLFEVDADESKFENAIRSAFRWLPHVTLKSVSCTIEKNNNYRGKRALIALTVGYDGETRDLNFKIPSRMDLLNGSLYNVGVIRKK